VVNLDLLVGRRGALGVALLGRRRFSGDGLQETIVADLKKMNCEQDGSWFLSRSAIPGPLFQVRYSRFACF
jgi:hypothetical protein